MRPKHCRHQSLAVQLAATLSHYRGFSTQKHFMLGFSNKMQMLTASSSNCEGPVPAS